MNAETVVELRKDGTVELPKKLRRGLRAGARFAASSTNGTIVLKPISKSSPKPPSKWSPEEIAEFEAMWEETARHFRKNKITLRKIRETVAKVQEELYGTPSRQLKECLAC